MQEVRLSIWPGWQPCPYIAKTFKIFFQNLMAEVFKTWYTTLDTWVFKFVQHVQIYPYVEKFKLASLGIYYVRLGMGKKLAQ